MFIAMNRFQIRKGFEEAFEKRWRERESFLHQFDGFVRFYLLRQAAGRNSEESVEFISHSQWRDLQGFEEWMNSDQSRKAHSSAEPPPKEMFMGPPQFRGYEIVLDTVPGHRTDFRSPAMDARVERSFVNESAAQIKIRERNIEAKLPPIHIGLLEGRLIEILLRSVGAKRGVEIGTLGGYSTSWLARALPADGNIITIERDAVRADLARRNFEEAGLGRMIEVRSGDARDVLKNLEALKDLYFVFIDADKQNYGNYVKWALPRLRKGGLLIADNAYIWGGMNYFGGPDEAVKFPPKGLHSYEMAEFKGMSDCWEQLRSHPEVASLILPTGEGLGVALKT